MNPQERIAANMATVEAHFHSEAEDEVDRALDLYTDDIVWEAPARRLLFRGKQAVADNYRKMFGAMRNVKIRPLRRFATEDRVVDDCIVTFTLTGDGVANIPAAIGSDVDLRLVHIFEMREGKISREIAYEMYRTD